MANSSSILTPPLSPKSTPTDISMHSSSKNSNPLTQILTLYHKATSTFLLRQLAAAYSTSLEAIELLARTNTDYGLDHSDNVSTQRSFYVLKQKLWILHSTIYGAMLTDRAAAAATAASSEDSGKRGGGGGLLNSVRSRVSSSKDSPEKLVRDLWKRLVDDYAGFEGDVDGQVMVPFRSVLEGPKDPLMTNYERLVELYLLHVLAKLGEWTSATDFLQYNTVLSDSSKKSYGKILDKLHQKSLRPKKQKSSLPSLADSRSSNTSASPSISSTSVSSPTLSSASTMGSPATSHTLEPRSNGSSSSSSVQSSNYSTTTTTTVTKKSASTIVASSSGRSKVAVGKKGSSTTTVQATKAQGRLMILLRYYVEQIKTMSAQMGTNQLMVIVGLVVFMGVLSRNRAKASKYLKLAANKVMQTVKMGTTVTSI
ncbi:hypothetical protein BGZ95_000957 [Linnemannia exigua]|uniref:Uncharacterized protein n=1 Tax=Linnemannia exigua TaxID=604196 RepID=A0AAD4H4E3_9FUNG|nr:hypothetical protein BGZ95_000957 [Linnemannia exigua]